MKSINADTHIHNMECLTNILSMIKRANEASAHYENWAKNYGHIVSYSYLSAGRNDVKKWKYISERLQRYYFKKLADLTSQAFDEVPKTIEYPHITNNAF